MYTYTIKTDATEAEVEAETIDHAAALFAAGERIAHILSCRALLSYFAGIEGAWAWIESDDAPDGDRRGGSTPESLAGYLAGR